MTVIYNPLLNEIKVLFNTRIQKKYQVSIINVMGRNLVNKTIEIAVLGKNSIQLSTTGLPKGIYLVRLRDADTIISVKKIMLN